MSNEEVPMLFSNATNWIGKPFMRIEDYLTKVNEKPNFDRQAYEIVKEHLQFTDLNSLETEEERQEAKRLIEE